MPSQDPGPLALMASVEAFLKPDASREGGASRSGAFTVTHNADARRFEIDLGGAIAFTTYELRSDTLVLPHTETPPGPAGRRAGPALAEAAFAYARANGLFVMPTCPFIARYIRAHPEHQTLLRPRRV